jgi:hypothetical protein
MAIDADDFNMLQTTGQTVPFESGGGINPEFIFLKTGRNIRMGFGIDIRIDPDSRGIPD